MSGFYDFAQWLYDSEFGTALRESQYVFQLVEGTHLLGLAFSVGLLALVDLRLAGVWLRDAPVQQVLTQLRPFIIASPLSIKLLACAVFAVKFFFIFLAGINFLWFELGLAPYAAEWANRSIPPLIVRIAGWTSLALWSVFVMSGRLIPYSASALRWPATRTETDMTILAALQRVQDTEFGILLRKSNHLVGASFQFVHILGFVLLLASVTLIDLRLLELALLEETPSRIVGAGNKLLGIGLSVSGESEGGVAICGSFQGWLAQANL